MRDRRRRLRRTRRAGGPGGATLSPRPRADDQCSGPGGKRRRIVRGVTVDPTTVPARFRRRPVELRRSSNRRTSRSDVGFRHFACANVRRAFPDWRFPLRPEDQEIGMKRRDALVGSALAALTMSAGGPTRRSIAAHVLGRRRLSLRSTRSRPSCSAGLHRGADQRSHHRRRPVGRTQAHRALLHRVGWHALPDRGHRLTVIDSPARHGVSPRSSAKRRAPIAELDGGRRRPRHAAQRLTDPGFASKRRVIDVSATAGPTTVRRPRWCATGWSRKASSINGLPVMMNRTNLGRPPDALLDKYYEENVTAAPARSLIVADN